MELDKITDFPGMRIAYLKPLSKGDIRDEADRYHEPERTDSLWSCGMDRAIACACCSRVDASGPYVYATGRTPQAAFDLCMERLVKCSQYFEQQ